MKRIIAAFVCFTLVIGCVFSFSAEVFADNDVTFSDTIISADVVQRSNTKTATAKNMVYQDDVLIAEIAFRATFQYNGLSVSVVSMSVTQCQTYNGWSFTQTSFTGSGSSVLLKGKLTHPSHSDVDVSISLSCDPDGNIY